MISETLNGPKPSAALRRLLPQFGILQVLQQALWEQSVAPILFCCSDSLFPIQYSPVSLYKPPATHGEADGVRV